MPPLVPISQQDVDALELAASQRIQAQRPTRPPFPWADTYFTAGVTGTNGKTSTAYMLAAIFRAAGNSVISETTIGYRIDDEPLEVPRTTHGFLSALQQGASRGVSHAVVEATSQALARGYAKLWRFDLGVFTNLSRDHLAVHGSWEHYLASKAQLFVHLAPGRTAVLNAHDPASTLLDRIIPEDVCRLWFGSPSRGNAQHQADLSASQVDVSATGTRIELVPGALSERLGGRITIPLVGDVFAENALAAAAAGLAAGCEPDDVVRGLATCPMVPGRFELVHQRPLIFIDFAHTPDALARVLDTARKLVDNAKLIVVFGAGGERDQEKRKPMGRAVGQRADLAIVTNDNPRREDPAAIAKEVASGCRKGGRAYVCVELDRRAAIEMALLEAREQDVVVIAGKGHEQGQTVGGRTLPFSDAQEVRRIIGDDWGR